MYIPGYENLYTISRCGEVKNKYGNILRHSWTKKDIGYKKVQLTKDGKRKSYLVHRLVALTYLANPYNLPEVNHIDGNKLNNCIENLEWCTRKQNMKHFIEHIGVSEFSKERLEQCKQNGLKYGGLSRKLSFEDAENIREEYMTSAISMMDLSKKYNVSNTIVHNIIYFKSYRNNSKFNKDDIINGNKKYKIKSINDRKKAKLIQAKLNKSKLGKGVSFNKNRNTWQVQKRILGKRFHLGNFSSKEEAIKVLNEFEKIYYPTLTGEAYCPIVDCEERKK